MSSPFPGATITLPLSIPLSEGTTLSLFKYDPDTSALVNTGIVGTVDLGGATASFTGVTDFSIFAGFQDVAPPQINSISANPNVLWPANLAVFALGAVRFWQSAHRARAKHVCAIMLAHLRCPCCGYDIRGLPTAPEDGATICPECGCAWKLHESQSPGGQGDD